MLGRVPGYFGDEDCAVSRSGWSLGRERKGRGRGRGGRSTAFAFAVHVALAVPAAHALVHAAVARAALLDRGVRAGEAEAAVESVSAVAVKRCEREGTHRVGAGGKGEGEGG